MLLESEFYLCLQKLPVTEYMLLSRHQNAGQNRDMKTDDRCFQIVHSSDILGTTITNQIKRQLNSGNACYHSVQNFFSSSLQSENIKIRIYNTIVLPVVLYGCEIWSLILTLCRLAI
jgi:hypothetical protein